jgi:protein ImuA
MVHAPVTALCATTPAVASRRGVPVAGPEALHPALWRAHQLGRRRDDALPTGFAALDAELPGGGWPAGALTELLLPHAGIGELRLLAPALAAVSGAGRSLMWFDPPAQPSAATLQALGIDTARLLLVHGRDGLRGRARALLPAVDVLWALEQALRSAQVGAVVAWLPSRLRADALRRLQLAAQAHDGPAFVLRDLDARLKPSPAPLRLVLAAAGADRLAVRMLKRRGPPMAQPLQLALAPSLSPSAQQTARRWTYSALP